MAVGAWASIICGWGGAENRRRHAIIGVFNA